MRFSFFKKRNRNREIAPEDIFIDGKNLPKYEIERFQGHLEKPISQKTVFFTGLVFLLIGIAFSYRVYALQIMKGQEYFDESKNNSLKKIPILADRGIVKDRNGELLVWNTASTDHPEFSSRKYTEDAGMSHLLGYISYPAKDKSGIYYSDNFTPKEGAELLYDAILAGKNGNALLEVDAVGKVKSESTIDFPREGAPLILSIDSRIQNKLYKSMSDLSEKIGFTGGAGAIMNINTGELIAITSYPEFDSNVMTDSRDGKKIADYQSNSKKYFLNRAIEGVYTPGSIVKPYIALGALNEKTITSEKKILSTGSISIPNPYDKTKPSIFNDWKAHGWVDMRQAIAVSSDVYFYEVGGGFEDQKGLGILNIKKYMQLFGFGAPVPGDYSSDTSGILPDPAWKEENFPGDVWRVGDTYNTSIGQYGMQVTPLQALRAIASVANNGKLVTPTILKEGNTGKTFEETLPLPAENYSIIREGMHKGVTGGGTAAGLFSPEYSIAAKTGTAELGAKKAFVNSWVTGFFPYENPKYAFVVMMEKGPKGNIYGATFVMRELLDWMVVNTPDYLK